MKLERVVIKNFRSIKEAIIEFDPACRILVGINESGKSNILEALSLLDASVKVGEDDLREELPNEDTIDNAEVEFVFEFQKDDLDKLFESTTSKILSKAKNPRIASVDNEDKKIREIYSLRKISYIVDIKKKEKLYGFPWISNQYKILDGWFKTTNACPKDFTVEFEGQQHRLRGYEFIYKADIKEQIPNGYLEKANKQDLNFLLNIPVFEIMKKVNSQGVLFWEYDESNILPGSLNMMEFAADPDICTPLKNMFLLAGIEADNIETKINDLTSSHIKLQRLQNYFDKIAERTTQHFRSVWKEYKGIKFSLQANGDRIVLGVKEKNVHDFARRSDGFKRFVSFLLMISVSVKVGQLRDTLLLIDEPDVGLHPSGAKYLRDELIKIAKKNYVVYSTHSIFMIDQNDIGRHYMVKKEAECTSIEQAQESNIFHEEVLYNALGCSVLEIIKEKVLIFEGWRDEKLFHVALEGAETALKRKYEKIGVSYAKGASRVSATTPLIKLAERECLIVSDSDVQAKQYQKTYTQERGFGDWKTYQDVESTIKAVTGEDFVKNNFIIKQVNTVLSRNNMGLAKFKESDLLSKKDKLGNIRGWLNRNGVDPQKLKEIVDEIKELIFDELEYKNVDIDEYAKLLKGIAGYFEGKVVKQAK